MTATAFASPPEHRRCAAAHARAARTTGLRTHRSGRPHITEPRGLPTPMRTVHPGKTGSAEESGSA